MEIKSSYLDKSHIIVQNTQAILDPGGREGVTGSNAELCTHLLARALHLGLGATSSRAADSVILSQSIPSDFIQHIAAVTGESPDLLYTKIKDPSYARDMLDTANHLDPNDYVLNPYIQWDDAANFSLEIGIPMAFTPADRILKNRTVEIANDKAYMRRHAKELGLPIAPEQTSLAVEDTASILALVQYMIAHHDGAFLQANKSGGGRGNVEMLAGNYGWRSKLANNPDKDEDPQELRMKLCQWAKEMGLAGSDEIIVAPYLHLIESHTVTGFIPPKNEGDPYAYGIFRQELHPSSHDYEGFEWPAKDPYALEYGPEMHGAALRWFKHLQDIGYVGPSDVDYIIGTAKGLGTVLAASESNTRWDAFRFALQHVARIQGWNLRDLNGINPNDAPSVYQLDHVPTNCRSTQELVARLIRSGIPVLSNETDVGIVPMVPPRYNNEGHCETALAVLALDAADAKNIYNQAAASII